jgi:hypothetical protein
MKNAKEWDSAKNTRKEGEKVLEEQRLGSEFEEARGRCTGPFPSLVRDPTLHLPGGSNLTVLGHHHSLLLLLCGKVVGYHRCEVLAIYDACDWNKGG